MKNIFKSYVCKKILLVLYFNVTLSMYAMDIKDPIVQAKFKKIVLVVYKIFNHVTKLNPICIDKFRWYAPTNNLEILKIICLNGDIKTILPDQVPNNLMNQFNLAYQDIIQYNSK